METLVQYSFPIEVKKVGEEENVEDLKEFFNQGKEWASLGCKVYYCGVSGIASARIWNAIRPEVIGCAERIERFTHLVGPVVSYDKTEGHPFIKMVLNERLKERVTIGLNNVRAIYHEMLMLATKSSISQFERGRLIMEKPHDVFAGRTARQKAILDVERDHGSSISKNEIRKLFLLIQRDFKYRETLAKRVENPDDCCRLTDEDIKLIAEKSGEDFDTITTEEIKTMVKRLNLEYVPVVEGDKY